MASIVTTSRVAIVGMGLLGGSLAKRLQQLHCRSVFGITRRTDILQQACDDGVIEAGSDDPAEILPIVDLTFLCVPLTASIAFVDEHIESFRPGSIVTDVGSVKGSVVDRLRDKLYARGVYFIGSHPMAGSEKSGFEYSQADLYDQKIVFLTPTPEDDESALHLLREFWNAVGACPIELSAQRHDQAVAFTSHLPHVLASALTQAIFNDGDVEARDMAAAGALRDMTRVAESNSAMWTDICRHNTGNVLDAMAVLQRQLTSLQTMLEAGDWEALSNYLAAASELRARWHQEHGKQRGF